MKQNRRGNEMTPTQKFIVKTLTLGQKFNSPAHRMALRGEGRPTVSAEMANALSEAGVDERVYEVAR